MAGWLAAGGERDFDLLVAFYGDDDERFAELCRIADRIWRIKGGKAQNLRSLILSGQIDLSPYSHVWLPDDDLIPDPRDIPRLFDLAEHFDFWVCQPAFDPLGRVSFKPTATATERDRVRLVNLVEMTCPLFRRDALETFLAVFDGSLSGYGLGLWFGHVLDAEVPGRFGIIDAITVFNPHERHKAGGFREIEALKRRADRIREYQVVAARHGIVRRPLRQFGVRPLPQGWRAANPPRVDPPRFPRPTDLALDEDEARFLAGVMTPAPSVVVQAGMDGVAAVALNAGAGLVVAVDDSLPWLQSCRADPALARPLAEGRLVLLDPQRAGTAVPGRRRRMRGHRRAGRLAGADRGVRGGVRVRHGGCRRDSGATWRSSHAAPVAHRCQGRVGRGHEGPRWLAGGGGLRQVFPAPREDDHRGGAQDRPTR